MNFRAEIYLYKAADCDIDPPLISAIKPFINVNGTPLVSEIRPLGNSREIHRGMWTKVNISLFPGPSIKKHLVPNQKFKIQSGKYVLGYGVILFEVALKESSQEDKRWKWNSKMYLCTLFCILLMALCDSIDFQVGIEIFALLTIGFTVAAKVLHWMDK
ncbi:MAG: hypothetical protein GY765_01950 [bacterium]|nr:hypothetical protein [bacterium]